MSLLVDREERRAVRPRNQPEPVSQKIEVRNYNDPGLSISSGPFNDGAIHEFRGQVKELSLGEIQDRTEVDLTNLKVETFTVSRVSDESKLRVKAAHDVIFFDEIDGRSWIIVQAGRDVKFKGDIFKARIRVRAGGVLTIEGAIEGGPETALAYSSTSELFQIPPSNRVRIKKLDLILQQKRIRS